MLRTLLPLLTLASFALAADADQGPIGGYVPKQWPCYIALGFYGISTLIFWIRFFMHGRQRYMLVGTIGMTCMSIGFGLRIWDASVQKNGRSLGAYVAMTMFILLSPCAFLAQDYVLIQRLARCLPSDVAKRCFILPARKVVCIFVTTDIITFWLQAGGGGLEASKTTSMVKLGQKIALIGLIIQLASFGFFTIALLLFGQRLRSRYPDVWTGAYLSGVDANKKWRKLYWTLLLTTVGILIRSAFRIAEFAQGFNGYLTTHEGFFYLLDALPLWCAMTCYCFVWPPVQLEGRDEDDHYVMNEVSKV